MEGGGCILNQMTNIQMNHINHTHKYCENKSISALNKTGEKVQLNKFQPSIGSPLNEPLLNRHAN